MTAPLGPDEIPDDTGTGRFAAFVAEDLVRSLGLRVAGLAAIMALGMGTFTGSASAPARTAGVAVGVLGLLVLTISQFARWPRTRQWLTILAVVVTASVSVVVLLAA